jgi:hypothetical protein
VLEALACALKLDEDAAAHLHALSHPTLARRPDEPKQAPMSIEQADRVVVEHAGVRSRPPHGSPRGQRAGFTGVAAAVANAVYHATGKRIRTLPISPKCCVSN